MTRVNLVPVGELHDQHLIAEYRELTMVPAALQKSLRSPKFSIRDIPKTFTLNKGHVKFFYDKGLFLYKRYAKIIKEMKRRGFNPDPSRFFPLHVFPDGFINDWEPSVTDIKISRDRIRYRVSQKPDWYRMTESVYNE